MTTVGIIDAKIELDAAGFMAKIEEVKAAVSSLSNERVTVTIDVDASRALAQIEAVKAAAASIEHVNPALHGAGGGSGGSGASTAGIAAETAAVDRLAAAERRERDDAAGAAVAEHEVGNARQQSARAAVEDAAATRSAASATDNFGNSSRNASTRTMLIASAVGFLVAAIAPLGGYAIGVAGALGMMGASGALAVLGIVQAMRQGTAEGLRFKAGLNLLQGDLNKLAATSAHAIAPGFFQAIQLIQGAMPMLNASMGAFGGILGSTVVAGIGAVLNIIRQLNPLFLTAALYVRNLAQAFQSWTAGSALQQFGDYAISVLPRVGQILGDIVTAAVHLAGALAPLGMALLNVVDFVVRVIDSLARMGPLLSYVAGAALLTGGAFKSWAFIAPIINRVSVALGGMKVATAGAFLPIAAIAAGLTLVGFVIDRATHAYNTGALGVSAYSNALLNSNGHVNQAINRVTALEVKTQGLGPSLRIAGVSQAQFSAAVLKGGSAIDQMVGHMRNANEGARTYAVGAGRMVNAQNQVELGARRLSAGVQQAVKAYNQYRVSLGLAGNQTAAQLVAQTALAARMHATVGVLTAAQAAQKQTALQAQIAAAQFRLEGDAAGLLNQQLDKLNGANISDAEAMGQAAQAIKGLTLVTTNGKAALTGMSLAALQNRGAIAQVASANNAAVAAEANHARTVGQVTGLYHSLQAQLVATAVRMGASKSEATALAASLMKMPKNIQTKITLRDEQAKAALAQTNSAVNKFTGAPHVGKVNVNNSNAIAGTTRAQQFADKFRTGNYTAALKANGANALSVTQAAMAKALGFSRAQYMAILKANNGAALSATATAQQRARAFTTAAYMAILRANPNPANSSAAAAEGRARTFAHGFYQAILRGDASSALAAVRAARYAVMSINGLVAHTYVDTIYRRKGAQSVKREGGTIGMARGGTPPEGFSVRGPGSAWDDRAGLYALANGEEVISNMRGQADAWRPLLRAINAGKVSMATFEELGRHAPTQGRSGAHKPERQVNLGGIHIHQPVTQDPVTSAQHAAQSILAYVNYP